MKTTTLLAAAYLAASLSTVASAQGRRVLGVLKNPSYAGIYVFGRYQYRREINLDGEVRKRMQAVAMPDRRVSLQQHHEEYITVEEFMKNRERLQKNRTNGAETVLSGQRAKGWPYCKACCCAVAAAMRSRYATAAMAASVPHMNAIWTSCSCLAS